MTLHQAFVRVLFATTPRALRNFHSLFLFPQSPTLIFAIPNIASIILLLVDLSMEGLLVLRVAHGLHLFALTAFVIAVARWLAVTARTEQRGVPVVMVEGREVEDEVKNGRKLALALLAANAFLMVRVGMKMVEAARGKEWRHEGIFYALDALPVLGELSSSPLSYGLWGI